MKHFKEKLIKVIEFSELDLEYPFYDGDDRNDVDGPDEDVWSDTVSMSIDDAIKALNTLKEMGSNRVYIVAHTDHCGYIFTGVDCEVVSNKPDEDEVEVDKIYQSSKNDNWNSFKRGRGFWGSNEHGYNDEG